jgi:hypothetical protein
MERANEKEAGTLIELGSASTDTKGGMGDHVEAAGLWRKMGISDE